MEVVYKCEYCDKYFTEKNKTEEHENLCGYNPKNKITDKKIFKISRIKDKVEETLTYMFLFRYRNQMDEIKKEFERATMTNCPASVYENKRDILTIINRVNRIENEKEVAWFKKITERDNSMFINAIEEYMEMEV